MSLLFDLPHRKFLTLDFETEGLNLVKSRPWQVAWIVGDNKGNVLKERDYMLDVPDLQMRDIVAKLTGFTWETYNQRKVPIRPVIEELVADMRDCGIVGQNILGFDVYMLAVAMRMAGLKVDYSYIPRVIDTKALSKSINLDIKPDGVQDLILWQYKVLNLEKRAGKNDQLSLLKKYGIPFDETKLHDALYDVHMTNKLFLEMANRIKC